MSMIRPNGRKVLLPRAGMQEQWTLITRHYARSDPRNWKYLAMLALKENAGWPLESIGNAFGHPKGHISRCLITIKQELRSTFAAQDLFGIADPDRDEAQDEELAA